MGGWVDGWILKCPFGPEDSKLGPKHKSSSTSSHSRTSHFCDSICKVSIYLLKHKGVGGSLFILILLG